MPPAVSVRPRRGSNSDPHRGAGEVAGAAAVTCKEEIMDGYSVGQEGNEVIKMPRRAHDAVDEQHRRISGRDDAEKFTMHGLTSFG